MYFDLRDVFVGASECASTVGGGSGAILREIEYWLLVGAIMIHMVMGVRLQRRMVFGRPVL